MERANPPILVAAGVHNQLSALLGDPQATPLTKQRAAGSLEKLSRDPANRQPLVAAGVHTPLSALFGDPQVNPVVKLFAGLALENLFADPCQLSEPGFSGFW